MRNANSFHFIPTAQARAQLEASQARLRRMDLAVMEPEETVFDPYLMARRQTPIEAVRDQDRLEMMYMAEPGKLRYVVARMLSIGRSPYTKEATFSLWLAYARRLFDAAVMAGNPEAGAIVALCAMADFAAQCELKRARINGMKKAAITRARNKAERTTVRDAITDTDAAIEAVFQTADTLANAEQ